MNVVDLGLLVLRAVSGLIFAAHGAQKAFGWWNGPGYAGWTSALQRMAIRPGPWWAVISIGAELVGGLLLALGFLTPLAAAALLGQSIVIVFAVHWSNGFWNGNRGWEYPITLAAGVVAIAAIGPGAIALDATLGLTFSGPVRMAAAVVGVLGGLLAVAIRRFAPPSPTGG